VLQFLVQQQAIALWLRLYELSELGFKQVIVSGNAIALCKEPTLHNNRAKEIFYNLLNQTTAQAYKLLNT
jgi:1,2-phenylacetyl-CoA epoxidase catalytic subunit